MPKFHKMRSIVLMLIFVTTLMSWLVQQPLFAAVRQQTTATDAATTYVVQAGDTLSSIARRFETTVAVLMELNNLTNPNVIYVGQTLLIRAEEATPTPGSTVPEATPTQTATAVTTPTIMATPEATVTITVTPVVTATVVWTDPQLPIEVFSPVGNGLYHSPIEVIGFSQTFEGNVNLRLSDDTGNVLAERNTIGGSVDVREPQSNDDFAFFHSYLRFSATEPITGLLEIFESSAQDGSEINKVSIPMTLLPGQRVIDINNLTPGKTVCSPIVVAGYSNTFEATLLVDLSDRAGDTISQTNTMGGNLGVYAEFLTTLESDEEEVQPLLVGAYEEAASGAGAVDRTRFPVTLYPAGSTECP